MLPVTSLEGLRAKALVAFWENAPLCAGDTEYGCSDEVVSPAAVRLPSFRRLGLPIASRTRAMFFRTHSLTRMRTKAKTPDVHASCKTMMNECQNDERPATNSKR